LHEHGKQALFNFAGESSRNPQAWKRAAAAGIDGLLTDYPLECRAAWRAADRGAAAAPPLDLRGGMERRYAQQGVGLAVSTDLLHWQRSPSSPVIPASEEIASLAIARSEQGFVAISQPMDLKRRSYWLSNDLQQWQKGPPVNFRASIDAETLSNPFLFDGRWTVLYEQKDRIYRAVLHPPTGQKGE
jgi:hypothetical protein